MISKENPSIVYKQLNRPVLKSFKYKLSGQKSKEKKKNSCTEAQDGHFSDLSNRYFLYNIFDFFIRLTLL